MNYSNDSNFFNELFFFISKVKLDFKDPFDFKQNRDKRERFSWTNNDAVELKLK